MFNPIEWHAAFRQPRWNATLLPEGFIPSGKVTFMRNWFIGLLILLGAWVAYNLIAHDEYDASLRPLYWLMDEFGVRGPR